MRLRTLLLIGGLLGLVFGIGFLLGPRPMLTLYGVSADPPVVLLARFFGAALVQVGLVFYLIRDVGDPKTQRGVVIGSFIGSVAGLVVASSFVLYAIAFGVDASRRALLVAPSTLLGAGPLVALTSGLPAVLRGQPFMTAQWAELPFGAGTVALGTPLVFDLGVCLAVIGVVLTIVFTLAEVSLSED